MKYPDTPGHKRGAPGTSAAAAGDAASWAATLRQQALELLRAGYDLTADEIAAQLDCHPLAMRPRISELRTYGLIVDSGRRRPNAISGKPAAVWTVARPGAALDLSQAVQAELF